MLARRTGRCKPLLLGRGAASIRRVLGGAGARSKQRDLDLAGRRNQCDVEGPIAHRKGRGGSPATRDAIAVSRKRALGPAAAYLREDDRSARQGAEEVTRIAVAVEIQIEIHSGATDAAVDVARGVDALGA